MPVHGGSQIALHLVTGQLGRGKAETGHCQVTFAVTVVVLTRVANNASRHLPTSGHHLQLTCQELSPILCLLDQAFHELQNWHSRLIAGRCAQRDEFHGLTVFDRRADPLSLFPKRKSNVPAAV